jgi:hypothetical protein
VLSNCAEPGVGISIHNPTSPATNSRHRRGASCPLAAMDPVYRPNRGNFKPNLRQAVRVIAACFAAGHKGAALQTRIRTGVKFVRSLITPRAGSHPTFPHPAVAAVRRRARPMRRFTALGRKLYVQMLVGITLRAAIGLVDPAVATSRWATSLSRRSALSSHRSSLRPSSWALPRLATCAKSHGWA